jgi:hypothetical protein
VFTLSGKCRYSTDSNIRIEEKPKPVKKNVISFTETKSTDNMKHVKSFDQFTDEQEKQTKQWWQKPWYYIPLSITIILGLLGIMFSIIDMPNKLFSVDNDCDYEIIFMDKETDKTPVFDNNNPLIKIYISTPPEIVRIIDGTACINTEKDLNKKQVLIELENVDNYELVDRKQYFKKGVTEILVKRIRD